MSNAEQAMIFALLATASSTKRFGSTSVPRSMTLRPLPLIGGVVWLGYDNAANTPHTPFYCGNT
ncbi:MAG: hypothetical protein PHR58_07005, partial [Sphaerochaetaceae bacterium]|nr:hypothetical protein [Sphaerochaetaceae bacterium]